MAILKALKTAVFQHSHSCSLASRNSFISENNQKLKHKPLSTSCSKKKLFQSFISTLITSRQLNS